MNPSLLVLLLWLFGGCSFGFGLLFIFLPEFPRLKKLGIVLSIVGAIILVTLFCIVMPQTSKGITSAGSLVQQIFLFKILNNYLLQSSISP